MSPGTRKRTISSLIWTFLILLFIPACKSFKQQANELPDTRDRGTIRVSADESFKPIIDEQAKVYEANHAGTSIIVTYKPEADCLKDLYNDSVRMIIATRGQSEAEKEILVDSLQVSPESMVVARDGISVIVNNASDDTLLTMKDIVDILKGSSNKKYIPVFDGLKATSTVRFIIDSVLRGDSLTPKAMAARSSEGVIDYVSQNQGVIGFLGVSWIGNPEDPAEISYLKKVRMVYIESTDMPHIYVRPSQANIYIRRYPMVRDLVYIVKENYKGLGHGFADFMSGEIGQLIFRRAYLMPAQKNFGIRPVRLNEKTK